MQSIPICLANMFSYTCCFVIDCLWEAIIIFTLYCWYYDPFFSALSVSAWKNCLKVGLILSSIKLKTLCYYFLNPKMEIPATQEILSFRIVLCTIVLFLAQHKWLHFSSVIFVCVKHMYSKPDSSQRLNSWDFVFQTFHAIAPCSSLIIYSTTYIEFTAMTN